MNNISEIKVSYRNKVNLSDAPKIRVSKDAFNVFYEYWDKDEIELRESFKVLLLNHANIVKGIYEVSQGGVAGTIVDVKLVFAAALKSMSSQIVIAHNHPSGNLKPSQADIDVTKKIKSAGDCLDIKLLDHIIVSPYAGYYSFADEGHL